MDRVLIGPFDITAVSWRRWAEEPEQWTGNWLFIFLLPSSRASRTMPRSPRLADKALVSRVTRIGRTLEAEISIPSLHEP